MKKWMVSGFLALFLLCLIFPFALAEETVHSGSLANIQWTIDSEGVLTISGDGPMPAFQWGQDNSEWLEYCSEIKSIVINEGVTNIGRFAFMGCEHAQSISIPSSVKEIEEAFNFCEISDVYIPDLKSWLEIDYIDSDNDGLKSYIAYPTASMKKMFVNGKILQDIVIPKGITMLNPYSFRGLKPKNIYLPESVTEIQEYTFSDNRNTVFNVIAGSYAEDWCGKTHHKSKIIILITEISLSLETENVNKGKTVPIKVVIEPINATNKKLSWTSTDESIATVKDGKIQAKTCGECDIICESTDGSEICKKIHINVIQMIQTIQSKEKNITIPVGDTYKLEFTIKPEEATNKTILWACSNDTVCKIDNDGVVEAVSAGDCEVTGTTMDGSNKSISIKIHVPIFDTIDSTSNVTEKDEMIIPIDFHNFPVSKISHKASKDSFFLYYLSDDGLHIFPIAKGEATITLTSEASR